ncbi:hypothetical protein CHUAL_003003 [Chamberlinius hualienensis]
MTLMDYNKKKKNLYEKFGSLDGAGEEREDMAFALPPFQFNEMARWSLREILEKPVEDPETNADGEMKVRRPIDEVGPRLGNDCLNIRIVDNM